MPSLPCRLLARRGPAMIQLAAEGIFLPHIVGTTEPAVVLRVQGAQAFYLFLNFFQVQSPCLTESCSALRWSGGKKKPTNPWCMEAAPQPQVRCSPWRQVPHAEAISLTGNPTALVPAACFPGPRKYPAVLAKDLAVQLWWGHHEQGRAASLRSWLW